jgi:hypothetical protein
MVDKEKLAEVVLRVLHSLHGKSIDVDATSDEVANMVKERLKRLKLCKELDVDFEWGE